MNGGWPRFVLGQSCAARCADLCGASPTGSRSTSAQRRGTGRGPEGYERGESRAIGGWLPGLIDYLEFSEQHYHGVRDDTEAKLLRLRHQESLRQLSRRLKAERVRGLGLTRDELTGRPLHERRSHFAHVLSRSVYPEYLDCTWNGVVVNDDTHELLSAADLVDHTDLARFCEERGLSTAWRGPFVHALRDAQGGGSP